ncbi:MAG: response regulator [bacterium]
MHLVTEDSEPETADFSFRKAKLDHYLGHSENLYRMSRFHAALEKLSTVFNVEPGYQPGLILQKQIEQSLGELSFSEYYPTNGHQFKSAKRRELILVVDQDERVLTVLTETMRKYGFAALGAATFDEAIEALGKFKPALIISEVNFENGPVGFDLYFWIRNNSELSTLPFLYLATRVTREMLIAGKRMGVDEFILKPLDEEVVMASVINSLTRRRKKAV